MLHLLRYGIRLAAATGIVALGSAVARAQPSTPMALRPVMVGAVSINAVEVEATSNFYKKTFGFKEIRRIAIPTEALEIIMNLGADANAARDNRGAALIIIGRPSTLAAESHAATGWARVHLVLVVDDMASVLARVREHGGAVPVEPSTNRGSIQSEVDAKPDPNGTHRVAMIQDPDGNAVELLSPK